MEYEEREIEWRDGTKQVVKHQLGQRIKNEPFDYPYIISMEELLKLNDKYQTELILDFERIDGELVLDVLVHNGYIY
jgi:hypothetical protein